MNLITFVQSLLRILRGRPSVPASLRDNALLQTIYHRRSVRAFAPQPLPDDVFQAILEAGRLAPSTVNLQTWTFAVFTAAEWRAAFVRPLPFGAQRAVIVMADTHRDKQVADVLPDCPLVQYTAAVMNASLAAMNMNIAAEALGVSSVMLSETGRSGLLDPGYLRERLGLPAGVVPLMTIAFGYPRGPYPPLPPKLPIETVCIGAQYREPDPGVMADWWAQMQAGYKAMRPLSSFQAQIDVYRSKMGAAEEELKEMVFDCT